jgi:hypothetical protein
VAAFESCVTFRLSHSPKDSTFFLEAAMLPKVDYRSLWLDSGDSDLSADADALAMKYLTDEQLSELARVRSKRASSSHGKNTDSDLRRVLGSRPSSRDMSMLPANHLSISSRKYLERYGLLNESDGTLKAPPVHLHNNSHDDTAASLNVSGEPAVMNVQQFLKRMAEKSYLANVVAVRNGSVESSGLSDESHSMSSGHGYTGERDNIDSIHGSFKACEVPTSTPADAYHKHRREQPPQLTPARPPRKDLPATSRTETVSNRVLDIDRLRELPKLL